MTFEGRRYRITRGAIDFTNPTRIEPFFDIEAETNVRVPGPDLSGDRSAFAGTTRAAAADAQLRSAAADGGRAGAALQRRARGNNQQDVELRALQNPNQAQTDILTARATQALTAPISAEVGKVVEQTFGVDTFQLTPSFVDPSSQQTVGASTRRRG